MVVVDGRVRHALLELHVGPLELVDQLVEAPWRGLYGDQAPGQARRRTAGRPAYAVGERRVERDLGDAGQRLRDGAVHLRALGVLDEPVVVEPGDRADDLDRALQDPLARLERDGHRRLEPLGRRPRAGEGVREGHREARRPGGGDQLLRARAAVGRLGPRRPGDVERPERAAADALDRAAAVHQRAVSTSPSPSGRSPFSRLPRVLS